MESFKHYVSKTAKPIVEFLLSHMYDEDLVNLDHTYGELLRILIKEIRNNESAVDVLKRIIQERDVLKIHFNHSVSTKNNPSVMEILYKELATLSKSKELEVLDFFDINKKHINYK